ncbi:Uncharacterized protein dnm_000050 [Desulfonema magnum]|uniref:Uncharacterized protein n=1 Tax=Desulfonema magnum TaxID=45655 RepID=A0A975GK04_9BACT|nr:Uncharacterized protein dnm_000050 [Desulfonema magnum]
MLFRKRKNKIFALRIRSELPKSAALGWPLFAQKKLMNTRDLPATTKGKILKYFLTPNT